MLVLVGLGKAEVLFQIKLLIFYINITVIQKRKYTFLHKNQHLAMQQLLLSIPQGFEKSTKYVSAYIFLSHPSRGLLFSTYMINNVTKMKRTWWIFRIMKIITRWLDKLCKINVWKTWNILYVISNWSCFKNTSSVYKKFAIYMRFIYKRLTIY